MNRRQKAILVEIITVIVLTAIAVVAMLHLRDYVNRREAEMAIAILGNRIRQYRVENGLVPPENWVRRERENLPGNVRLGELNYRGRWIDFDSAPDEILAYVEQKSHSLIFKNGFFVLRLGEVLNRDLNANVNIEWMGPQELETTLAQQQSQMEIEMLGK